ncbi:MAG: hypothetical protein RBG13Loki_0408 [Promethearchaeota archaeon CR_4]|nr:MAG: hypothetical protein RBG13Loki_0408 [Candidatus Lokiarchaeota archaeon CR_4]
MGAGRAANLLWGSLHFTYVFLVSVTLPLILVNSLTSIQIIEGLEISFGQEGEEYFEMTTWLVRLGLIMAAFAFFKGSSPKYSRRRSIGALLETIADIFYIFMYKFSGTSDIHIVGGTEFSANINLDQMLALYMGMILLYIFYNIWDLIDIHFWGRERAEKEIKKKMEKKWKKIMKKQGGIPATTESRTQDPLTSALTANKTQTTEIDQNTNQEANSLG